MVAGPGVPAHAVVDAGGDAVGPEVRSEPVPVSFFEHDEGALPRIPRGEGFVGRAFPSLGKDRDDLVAVEEAAFELRLDRVDEEPEVDAAFVEPRLDVGVGAVQYLEVDAGKVVFERADDPGKRVDGHAAERADAHRARLQALAGAYLLLERLFRGDDVLDEGKQLLAVRRRRHAVVVPGDQGHAPFAFDGIQQMRDPRLRVAGLLGGLREAFEPSSLDERPVASVHGACAFSDNH